MASSTSLSTIGGYLYKYSDLALARSFAHTGYGRSSVVTASDLSVVVNPDASATRGVIVRKGRAVSDGIVTELAVDDATLSFPAATGAAGTVTWGAVVIDLSWTGQVSTLQAIAGTVPSTLTAPVVPTAVTDGMTVGSHARHLLSLVPITPGSAVAGTPLPRAVWVEGTRRNSAARPADGTFNVNVQQSYVHLGGPARPGQYVVSGVAAGRTTSGGASTVGALGVSASINGAPGALITLELTHAMTNGIAAFPIDALYDHPGGDLSLDLVSLYPTPVQALRGSSLTATWVGPPV